ncbi:hypothetical protein BC826DRAFT_1184547 [Russula brevipes]|nr:hypothetical protein BC826DRAFT_1184547 [Russula brevipes]
MLTLLLRQRTPLAHHFRDRSWPATLARGPRSRVCSFRRFFTRADSVRVAAASLAFNVSACVQKGRIARIKGSDAVGGNRAGEEDGEWEMELVSAVAEALGSEEESEGAELTATLLIRLSPFYEDQLAPLLGVLQVVDG